MNKIIFTVPMIIITIVLISLILTLPTYFIWNWLMPVIFGLQKITLWQALGLTLLANIFLNLPVLNKLNRVLGYGTGWDQVAA